MAPKVVENYNYSHCTCLRTKGIVPASIYYNSSFRSVSGLLCMHIYIAKKACQSVCACLSEETVHAQAGKVFV